MQRHLPHHGQTPDTTNPATTTINIPAFWRSEPPIPETSDPALSQTAQRLAKLFQQIDGIGNHANEGYRRFAWSNEEAWLRIWFAATMQRRQFTVEVDAAGNQWAWLGTPSAQNPGVTFGSHLDSVPGGGPFDGPLGTLSAIVAYDILHDAGWTPPCPIGIANFHDEEGARFAIACFGSRVLTGVLTGADALERTDADNVSVDEALKKFDSMIDQVIDTMRKVATHDRAKTPAAAHALAGFSIDELLSAADVSRAPRGQQSDTDYLQRTAAHIELHIEQGCTQRDLGVPVAVADRIWPHGRWRIEFNGVPNHAGTTPINERHDPMLSYAAFVLQARKETLQHDDLRMTVGRVEVEPNGVNVIPSRVVCWLDCRAADETTAQTAVNRLTQWLGSEDREGVTATVTRESWTPATVFSPELRDRLANVLGHDGTPAAIIGTAAGHDAGILAETGHAAGMVFVRNRTGASHTPDEFATLSDAAIGVIAYARAVKECAELVSRGWRPRP